MNAVLWWATFRRSGKLLIVFALLLSFYLLATVGMYSPDPASDFLTTLPDAMKNAFGIVPANGLTGFIATGYYGLTFVMFLMIYCVIASNQLVAQLVDRGSMAYLLSTPVSRRRIAVTQASVLVISLLAILVLVVLAGWIGGSFIVDDPAWDVAAFMRMNVVGFLLFFVISGYTFLFSCLFNDAKRAIAASGFLSVFFYGLQIVSNMSDRLHWLQYVNLLAAFRPTDIVNGATDMLTVCLPMGAAGIALYAAAVTIFTKRDLPL